MPEIFTLQRCHERNRPFTELVDAGLGLDFHGLVLQKRLQFVTEGLTPVTMVRLDKSKCYCTYLYTQDICVCGMNQNPHAISKVSP